MKNEMEEQSSQKQSATNDNSASGLLAATGVVFIVGCVVAGFHEIGRRSRPVADAFSKKTRFFRSEEGKRKDAVENTGKNIVAGAQEVSAVAAAAGKEVIKTIVDTAGEIKKGM